MNRLARIGLTLALLAGLPTDSRAETREIVIKADGLEPRVLQVSTVDRVVFVNRSGRLVHLDFLGRRDQHHVYQVPGSIWAVFHQPGPHLYVVHFESGEGRRELRGVVEVGHTGRDPDLPECGRLTVEGICVEP